MKNRGSSNPSPFSTPTEKSKTANQMNQDELISLIKKISQTSERPQALQLLLSRRANIPDLALMVWFSQGTVVSLLSDLLNFYPNISSGLTNVPEAENVYNILIIFQVIAKHEDTRIPFLNSGICTYLLPFLKMDSDNSEAERFIGATIGIFVDMVKNKQNEVLQMLIKSEMIPICLNIMSSWNGVIRIAAAFVLSCLMEDDVSCKKLADNQPQVKVMLDILNQVLLDLCDDFDIHLSKSVISVYTKLLTYNSVVPIANELASKAFVQFQPKQNMDQQLKSFLERLQTLPKTK